MKDLLIIIISVAFVMGCASKSQSSESKSGMEISKESSKQATERFVGLLSIKGTSHFQKFLFTTLSGPRYWLIFDGLEDTTKKEQMRSMTGLKIEIEGLVTDRGIIFRDYRIVPGEGEIAIVGTRGEEGTIIDDESGEEFLLFTRDGRQFSKETGSVIWVIGERNEKGILVKRFGVIKKPQSSLNEEKIYLK